MAFGRYGGSPFGMRSPSSTASATGGVGSGAAHVAVGPDRAGMGESGHRCGSWGEGLGEVKAEDASTGAEDGCLLWRVTEAKLAISIVVVEETMWTGELRQRREAAHSGGESGRR